MPGHRYFAFTINAIPQDLTETPDLHFEPGKVRFARWQLERAPTTGSLHLQGFMQTKGSVGNSTAAKYVQEYPTGHFSPCYAGLDANLAYCCKEDSRVSPFKQFGTMPQEGSGARNDLKPFKDALKEKRSLASVLENEETHETYIKYHRGIKDLFDIIGIPVRNEEPTTRQVVVEFYYGPSGTGKTRAATSHPNFYKKPVGNSWFDNYNGQKVLVLDEFTGWLTPAELLQYTDIYAVDVNVKGVSHKPAKWEKVIITSNDLIEDWYKAEVFQKHKEFLSAITRRITKYVYFKTREEHIEFTNYDFMCNYLRRSLNSI
nr:replication associated protein [Apis mellifera virus-9]QBX89288.1 replication associated protein [Apis mellifera virus-9]QBX89290.1 replication associated protein [Apis mellifera virus-9]